MDSSRLYSGGDKSVWLSWKDEYGVTSGSGGLFRPCCGAASRLIDWRLGPVLRRELVFDSKGSSR